VKFAEILKGLRLEKGMSQDKLSQLVNINQSTIARWELSKTQPNASDLIVLAKFFDITVDQLLGIDEY
jgi:transcriptional regulator with XRE-family HTH domain